jgi:hypothetical protein
MTFTDPMLKKKTFYFFHQHKYVFGNVLKIHKYMPFVDMWLIFVKKSFEGPLCEKHLVLLRMGAADASRT